MTTDDSRALIVVQPPGSGAPPAASDVDKKIQKAVGKRTIDFTSGYVQWFQARLTSPFPVDQGGALQPTFASSLQLLPPLAYAHCPASNLASKVAHATWGKARSSVNAAAWTPDGRRCILGTGNGEFSLWNASNLAFESAMQAHTSAVRCITYTHNQQNLVSSDDEGRAKIFKPNFELLHVVQAHRDPCRCVTFAPTDIKFATSSDDSTIKVYDFYTAMAEGTMTGHGGDVRWVDWHPSKGVIASASKDSTVKVWEPRTGSCVATLHGHKNGIIQVRWNSNGNWLLTCSRDNLLKVFDVRTQREVSTFKGHTRDVTSCSWHPQHEEMFTSGSWDGTIMQWLVSRPEPQLQVIGAHDREVWALAWHPVGHVILSGSQDQSIKVWCRARPGDIFQAGGEDTGAIGGAAPGAPSLVAGAAGMMQPHHGLPMSVGFGAAATMSGTSGVGGMIPGIGAVGVPAMIPGIGAPVAAPPKLAAIPPAAPPPGNPPAATRGGPPGLGPGPMQRKGDQPQRKGVREQERERDRRKGSGPVRGGPPGGPLPPGGMGRAPAGAPGWGHGEGPWEGGGGPGGPPPHHMMDTGSHRDREPGWDGPAGGPGWDQNEWDHKRRRFEQGRGAGMDGGRGGRGGPGRGAFMSGRGGPERPPFSDEGPPGPWGHFPPPGPGFHGPHAPDSGPRAQQGQLRIMMPRDRGGRGGSMGNSRQPQGGPARPRDGPWGRGQGGDAGAKGRGGK